MVWCKALGTFCIEYIALTDSLAFHEPDVWDQPGVGEML